MITVTTVRSLGWAPEEIESASALLVTRFFAGFRAPRVVCDSEDTRSAVVRHGRAAQRTTAFRSGFPAAHRSDAGGGHDAQSSQGRLALLTCGRRQHDPEKAVDVLLEVIALVAQTRLSEAGASEAPHAGQRSSAGDGHRGSQHSPAVRPSPGSRTVSPAGWCCCRHREDWPARSGAGAAPVICSTLPVLREVAAPPQKYCAPRGQLCVGDEDHRDARHGPTAPDLGASRRAGPRGSNSHGSGTQTRCERSIETWRRALPLRVL